MVYDIDTVRRKGCRVYESISPFKKKSHGVELGLVINKKIIL